MKASKLNLFSLLAVMLLFTGIHLQAQQEINVDTDGKTITIIKKYTDKDGYEVTEKIIKEAGEGQDFDELLKELDTEVINGENIDIHVIKTDDDEYDFSELSKVDQFMRGLSPFKSKSNSCNSPCGSEKGKLNVYLDTNTYTDEGVAIDRVIEDGGADKAGLKNGDIILAIDGEKTNSYNALVRAMKGRKPNDVVKVDYKRGGEYFQSAVTLHKNISSKSKYSYNYNYNYNYNYKRNPCKPFIGVTLATRGENGVRIYKVIEGTAADKAELESGDRITAIDGTRVTTQKEIVRLRDLHKAGDYFMITYLRDGEEYQVEAQFTPCDEEEEIVEEEMPAEEKINMAPSQETTPKLELNNSLELESISAFPNPTSGRVTLRFTGEAVPTTVRLTDATGRVLMTEKLNAFDGQYEDEINLSKYAPGIYLINVIQGNKVYTEKIILTKNRA